MKTVTTSKTSMLSKTKSKKSAPVGVSNPSATSSVKRSGKTKVRAVPDFSKLHQKWEDKLQQGKACAKKPCTIVAAFDLSENGSKIKPLRSRILNDENEENQPPVVQFKADPKALKSITHGKGLTKASVTGRTTIASSKPMRVSIMGKNTKVVETKIQIPVTKEVQDSVAKSPDFEKLADVQKANGLDFQSDDSALKSILENKGIEAEIVAPKPPQASRQTLSAALFKTPSAPPQRSRLTNSVRRSIYYTDQKPNVSTKQSFYTEFTQRTVSRLTLDANSNTNMNSPAPKPDQSPAHPRSRIKVVPQRGSIYCKVQFSKNSESMAQEDAKTPQNLPKAVRILSTQKKATNSPALRQLKQTPTTANKSASKKWKDVLKQDTNVTVSEDSPTDRVVTKLDFNTEAAGSPENVKKEEIERQKLEELQALEKRLEEDIARQNEQAMNKDEDESPSLSNPNMPPVTHGNRVVFGMLSEKEIARRSSPSFNPSGRYDPKSPVKVAPVSPVSHKTRSLHRSPRMKGCGSPRFQRELSPLVRESKERIRPCRKFAIAKDMLDASIDIITVPATESDASILAPKDKSLNSSMQSPLQDLSPNVLHCEKRRSLSGTMKSPAGKNLEQQVMRIASVLDKANSSPMKLLLDKENLTPKSSLKLDKILDKENCYPGSPSSCIKQSPLKAVDKENLPLSPMCKLSLKDKLDSSSSSPSLSASEQENESPGSPLATRLSPAASPLVQKVLQCESPLQKSCTKKLSSGSSPKPSPRRKLGLGPEVLPCSPGGTKRRLSSPKDADENKKPERRVKFEDQQSTLESMNSQELSITLSESLAQFDSLSEEMSSIQSQCEDNKSADKTNNLLKKLEMISRKQEQLRKMQLKIQAQLEEQANGKASSLKANSPKQPTTPARYDSSQNYADFIAANVVDISPLTSTTPPRLPLPGVLSGADGYSPYLDQKQTFFPNIANETREKSISPPPLPAHDQAIPPAAKSGKSALIPAQSPAPSSPALYSPKPLMCGSAQLMQSAADFSSPVPIQTPLALRNMAIPGSCATGSSQHNSSIWDISCTPEDSPVNQLPATPPSAKSKYSSSSSTSSSVFSTTPQKRCSSGQVLSSSIPTNTLTFCSSNTPLMTAHTAHTSTTISSTFSPASYNSHITPVKASPNHHQLFHTHITPQKQTSLTATTDACQILLSSPKTPGLSSRVQTLSLDSPVRSPGPASPGTLSLAAHLPTSKTSTTPGISMRSMALSNAMSRFYDAMLDDEVALYACRMGGTSPAKMLPRIQDPVASTLMHGDEMHFIPVFTEQDDQQVPSVSPLRSPYSMKGISSTFSPGYL